MLSNLLPQQGAASRCVMLHGWEQHQETGLWRQQRHNKQKTLTGLLERELDTIGQRSKTSCKQSDKWGGRSRCTGSNGGERGAAELQTDKVASHETGATDAENPSCHGCRAVSFKVRKITCHLRLLEVELRGDGGGGGRSRVILRNCFNNGA